MYKHVSRKSEFFCRGKYLIRIEMSMEINIYAINIYARESEGISNVKLIYIFHSG